MVLVEKIPLNELFSAAYCETRWIFRFPFKWQKKDSITFIVLGIFGFWRKVNILGRAFQIIENILSPFCESTNIFLFLGYMTFRLIFFFCFSNQSKIIPVLFLRLIINKMKFEENFTKLETCIWHWICKKPYFTHLLNITKHLSLSRNFQADLTDVFE